ncbi:MAG: hypothetical protein QOE27_1379 [Solirubrobacteraceae bacterium]|nr:hypothetical protein [Solirubrobacteraceae bacterium]MEA2356192.1 hypothetical protein [Solirubrobacteraceae bacterium]
MDCFPCAVAKRNVELRLVEAGADTARIVAQVAATRCLMCALEDQQAATRARHAADA